MHFFSAEEVHATLDLDALTDAIALAFSSETVAPLRHVHAVSASDSLLLMPAWRAGEGGAIGVKLVTVFPGNRGSTTVNALYVLFDHASGEPRAVIDGEALTLRRTAAASLLAARYLAPKDSDTILIVGTGRLSQFMARAHCGSRDVSRLLLWGRNRERAQSLAKVLRDEGLPAEAAPDLEQAVGESQIITCATTAAAPIVLGVWLRPGTHLDLVGAFKRGMREVDDAAVARSQIYVDTYAGTLAEADDIVEPLARGVISRGHVLAELAELVTGKVAGRRSDAAITLFKSVGTAIEDLAAAQLLVSARAS